jgi:transmembrane sensor
MMVKKRKRAMNKQINMNDAKPEIIADKDAAREWLVRLYADDVTDSDKAAFKVWLSADAAHLAAYRAVETLWRDISALPKDAFASVPANIEPLPFTKRVSIFSNPVAQGFAIAAGLMLALLTTFIIFNTPTNSALYETQHAELKTITLEDGSIVTLSARSKLRTEFSKYSRTAVLISGRAYFDIEPDAAKPFTVKAAETAVTVTGTEFDVLVRPSGVQVAVTEGSVKVSDLTPPRNRINIPVNLVVGDKLLTAPDGSSVEKSHFDSEDLLAWQSGRLVYENTSLSDIVDDANRYRQKPIRIRNKNLANLKVTTSFRSNQSEQMLDGLEASYAVTIRENEHAIVIRPNR